MSNSGFIKPVDSNIGIYLHWNGGRDSVEAFLKYCELKNYRGLGQDSSYGLSRLAQVIGNYFGGSTSIGIDDYNKVSTDHGIYVVKGWEIVERYNYRVGEQRQHDLQEMLLDIDKAQPEKEQLGDYLISEEIPTYDVKIGDTVFMEDFDGTYVKHLVVGFGKIKEKVNGYHVYGTPYVNNYKNATNDYSDNINNYILTKTIRVLKEREKSEI